MARLSVLLTLAAIVIAALSGPFSISWWLALAALALLSLAVLDEIGPQAVLYAHRGHRGGHVILLFAGVLNTGSAILLGFALGRALAFLLLP
jgi:hypothetical protein